MDFLFVIQNGNNNINLLENVVCATSSSGLVAFSTNLNVLEGKYI